MTDLTTARWTRYGKDRLYVKTPDGTDVGSIDLLTGTVDVKMPEFELEVRALASKQTTEAAPRGPSAFATRPATTPDPIEAIASRSTPSPLGYDLAENAAGAAARAKRQEVNGRAPVWNLVARALGMKTEERNWRVGAKGEEKVGHELSGLPACWHVLHAVRVGDRATDVDHVVIGPGGVFTLNTKRHPGGKVVVHAGSIRVNNYSQPYLHVSRHEAERTSKLLTAACGTQVNVQPVIVFVDLDEFTLREHRVMFTSSPERLCVHF